MSDERRKDNLDETAKNAFTGYTMVVLGVVCFIIILVIVAAIVRLIVSAGAGAGI
jgi:CHASE3 domain sensor protein